MSTRADLVRPSIHRHNVALDPKVAVGVVGVREDILVNEEDLIAAFGVGLGDIAVPDETAEQLQKGVVVPLVLNRDGPFVANDEVDVAVDIG